MQTKLNISTFFQMIFALLIMSFTMQSKADDLSDLPNQIESIRFTTLPEGKLAITLQTTIPMQDPPAGFMLKQPPRIALDFRNIGSSLAADRIPVQQGPLKSINVAQTKSRTRMVLNLSKVINYTTSVKDKTVTILLEEKIKNRVSSLPTQFAKPILSRQPLTNITNINFQRGRNGEGKVIVDLSDSKAGININQKNNKIFVDFVNTNVSKNLQRRLNVINFGTPVVHIDTLKKGHQTQMVIEPTGQWEQSAYQTDKQLIIDVHKLTEAAAAESEGQMHTGEKLSLNFQNIEIRAVLQVIADFTGLNIITSDAVQGDLTLRLKDVPWDQALDIITKSKGLAMQKTGNVILVAPAEEFAAKEKLALEAKQQIENLEPLRTEVFTLKYMKAESLKDLLSDSKQQILSKRGSVVLDARTNTVFVQDTPKFLQQVQAIINKTDIPVKQVMIESRLVIADDTYAKSLGARFGVTQTGTPGSSISTVSGSIGNRFTAATDGVLTQGNHNGSVQTATSGGSVLTSSDGEPDLMSNLPVANAFGSFAYTLYQLSAGLLLNLELTAMESDNRGKIVSSPRVTTANQHKAKIASGTEIPYLEASASGAATVAFKPATLSLEVTPHITPNDKIIMELDVKKDSVGDVFNGIPSIKTQNINTQVLVGNGETAVLGGIYEQINRDDVDKVPFFGDLPVMGNLFKRKAKQNDKTELLIFITPKILDDGLAIR